MGGRGASGGGKYASVPLSSLERMRDRQQEIMNRNRIARTLDPDSSSAAVRRRQASAERAYNAAEAEIQEIDKAISRARRRRRNQDIPF